MAAIPCPISCAKVESSSNGYATMRAGGIKYSAAVIKTLTISSVPSRSSWRCVATAVEEPLGERRDIAKPIQTERGTAHEKRAKVRARKTKRAGDGASPSPRRADLIQHPKRRP